MKKYVLHPGYIRLSLDGDPIFISAFILARLYGVDIHQCLIARDSEQRCDGFMETTKDLIHLYPDHEGEYRLPQPESIKAV